GISKRLRRTALHWSPYLAVIAIFLFWRLFLFQHARMGTSPSRIFGDILSNPISELSNRAYSIVTDLIEAGLIAWAQTLPRDFFSYDRIVWVGTGLAIALVSGLLVAFCLT